MKENTAIRFVLAIALTMAIGLGMGFAQTATTPPTTTPPSTTPPTPGVDPMPPTTGPHLTPAELQDKKQIDMYLVNHPEIAEQLHNNPSLINNPQWLSQHPDVKQYMASHPGMQKLAAEHPDFAVRQAEQSAASDERHGLKESDAYLRAHPEEARQLAADPSLIDNKQYLAQHPDLANALATHPEIAQEAEQHPDAFKQAAQASYPKNPTPATKPPVAKKVAAPATRKP